MTSDDGKIIGLNNGSLTDRAKASMPQIKRQQHVTEQLIENATSPWIQLELMRKRASVLKSSEGDNYMGKLEIEN